MRTCDTIVAGHICLDLTPRFYPNQAKTYGDFMIPGALINVGECVVSTGGPVSNTGLALKTIGADVVLMGKVGNDTFGQVVIERMEDQGCGGGILAVDGEQTSYTIALAPPGIDRIFLHNPGANDTFCADDIRYELLDNARHFHFGYPPLMKKVVENDGEELTEIFKRAKQRGVTTTLDMSLPDPNSPSGSLNWEKILQNVLPYVDMFLPSIEEAMLFLDRDTFISKRAEAREKGCESIDLVPPSDYSRLSTKLIEFGAGVVALKSGHRGIYIHTANADRLERFGRLKLGNTLNWADRELWEPIFTIDKVASATGSGDCAIAGFIASILRQETIENALRYATAAGRQNVGVLDATSGICSFEKTKTQILQWQKGKLDINAPDWSFDTQQGLWHGPLDSHR